MDSGIRWVATDYHCNQRQKFHFTYSSNAENRTFKVTWYMTTECNDAHRSPTYYVCNDTQKLYIDNELKINIPVTYTSNGNTVYRGFTDEGSWLDTYYNNKVYHDLNGDYLGINRYVKVLGTKWASGSFTKSASNDGTAEFSVKGSFSWYGETRTFFKTFKLENSALRKKYTIEFKGNSTDLLPGNKSISNIPSTITKYYGDTKNLPTLTPKVSTGNYIFSKWSTQKTSSFVYPSTATTYNPGGSVKANKNLVLYAIWKKKKYSVTIDLGKKTTFNSKISAWITNQKANYGITWIKDSGSKIHTSIEYGKEIYTPPANCQNEVYGNELTGWKCKNTIYPSKSGTKIKVTTNLNITPEFSPKSLTIKLSSFPNYDANSIIRIIPCTYSGIITGDFSYTGIVPEGCEFIGWSTNRIPTLLNPESVLPINPDKLLTSTISTDEYYNDTLYIDKDMTVTRTFTYNDSKILYPVFRLISSFYVYTGNKWESALPYIYNGTEWKVSVGNIYSSDKWH